MGRKKQFVSQEYSTEKGGKNLKEGTKSSRMLNVFATGFFSVALIVGVSLVSFAYFFFWAGVQGTSMMLTLNAQGYEDRQALNTDSVIVNRRISPKKGDIIVVDHYEQKSNGQTVKARHIKRLIAMSTKKHIDTIHLTDKGLYYDIEISGNPDNSPTFGENRKKFNYDIYENLYEYLHDPSIDKPNAKFDTTYCKSVNCKTTKCTEHLFRQPCTEKRCAGKDYCFELVLPPGYIFYMGDNRGGESYEFKGSDFDLFKISGDCTLYGPKPASRIVGVVVETIKGKSTLQWALDKVITIVTFGIVNRW